MMTRTATSGISFNVFKNDKNAIVHSLAAKATAAYEETNPVNVCLLSFKAAQTDVPRDHMHLD